VLSGLPVPQAAQGQSLMPLIAPSAEGASRWRARPAFTQRFRSDAQIANPLFDMPDAYSVIDGHWKLVRNVWRPEGSPLPEFQLFDHAADPLDQTDLAAANPDVVERLDALLDDWVSYAQAARIVDDDTALENMSEAERKQLESLGYLQ
jgi:arylsulfatase A-like enzyme